MMIYVDAVQPHVIETEHVFRMGGILHIETSKETWFLCCKNIESIDKFIKELYENKTAVLHAPIYFNKAEAIGFAVNEI